MTINFEHYGKFFVTFYYDDEVGTRYTYDGQNEGYTLKEAIDFISANMEASLSIVSADIVDFETCEVVAIIRKDEEDSCDQEEEWYDYRDDYDEYGYNPYMGCYDFDC